MIYESLARVSLIFISETKPPSRLELYVRVDYNIKVYYRGMVMSEQMLCNSICSDNENGDPMIAV